MHCEETQIFPGREGSQQKQLDLKAPGGGGLPDPGESSRFGDLLWDHHLPVQFLRSGEHPMNPSREESRAKLSPAATLVNAVHKWS